MQFGMPTLVENRTLEENVALCAELGLQFVELNMNFPEYQVEQLEQTARLRALAEEAGIYYTIHLDENLNIADFNPLVANAYLETVRRTIAAARARLAHFHIHDGTENPPRDHLALGDGDIDLPERLCLAEACHARCVLETKTIAALRKSTRWLRR